MITTILIPQSPSSTGKSFMLLFEQWVISCKQMDCEEHTNYNSTRNMIRKWGEVKQENILSKINAETFCPGTYNRRLTMLKSFVDWLVQERTWKQNPLLAVQPKKNRKIKQKLTYQKTRRKLTTKKRVTA